MNVIKNNNDKYKFNTNNEKWNTFNPGMIAENFLKSPFTEQLNN